jgi:hypothetical protein
MSIRWQLEQLCAEYDSVDDFLHNLENRVLEESFVEETALVTPGTSASTLARAVSMSRQLSPAKGSGVLHGDDVVLSATVPLRRGLSHN